MQNVSFSLSVIQENKVMSPVWNWIGYTSVQAGSQKWGSGASWQALIHNLQQVSILQGSCHTLLICKLFVHCVEEEVEKAASKPALARPASEL
jgi:hypothetical protein